MRDSPVTMFCRSLYLCHSSDCASYLFVLFIRTPPNNTSTIAQGRVIGAESTFVSGTLVRQRRRVHGAVRALLRLNKHREEMSELTRVTRCNHNRSDKAYVSNLVLTSYRVAVILPGMMTLWAPVAGLTTGATGKTTPSRCRLSQKSSCS